MLNPNNEIIRRKIISKNKKNPKHIHKPLPSPIFHQVKHQTKNNNIIETERIVEENDT